MKKLILICGLIGIKASCEAQLPDVDIFLADFSHLKGNYSLSNPVNITHRQGYDSQPFFISDTVLFYTSIRDKQADIYQYKLKSGETSQITFTEESEYSPTLTPGGKYFSTVRVEKDSTQRLWKFPIGANTVPEIISKTDSVGYHCWIDKETLAIFVLTKPFTLQLLNLKTVQTKTLASDIGRCILKIPGKNAISFLEKRDSIWTIKELDLASGKIKDIVRSLPGKEDFCWTPDGTLLMGNGAKLYSYTPGKSTYWIEIADLSPFLKEFQRIAVSTKGTKIALVGKP